MTEILEESRIHILTRDGGKATFMNGILTRISWIPTESVGGEDEQLWLSAVNIHQLPGLMRFLRAVERTQLELRHGCRMVANDGEQLWFERGADHELEDIIEPCVESYQEKHGKRPNTLILNERDESDTSFWQGKIVRVAYMHPAQFRLAYQEDASVGD